MIGDPNMMSENQEKEKRIRTPSWRAAKMIRDPDTMPESRRKDKGSGHDVEESLKQ